MNYLRYNNIFMLCLIVLLQVNTLAHAQRSDAQQPSFVQLNNKPEFSVASGEQQHIPLSFLIQEGYHVQAHQVEDENLIPTELTMNASDDVILGDPIFPGAVEFSMRGREEALRVYSDLLEIKVPIKIVKSVEKGELFINGRLHYQACDDSKCYFPRDLNFSMKLNIQ